MKLPFNMSHHALSRAVEMELEGDEIRNAFLDPDAIVRSKTHPGWNYRRGRITLGVSEDRAWVTTVVWSTQQDWEAYYARGGDLTGRERRTRTDMNHLPRRRA